MKRLFFQLFKRSALLCLGLVPALCTQAMITEISEIQYEDKNNGKNKTIVIFGYSVENEGFMRLSVQKKHLKSFFKKFGTEGQNFDLLIQNNVALSEESRNKNEYAFFSDFYKKPNIHSLVNKIKVKIENFDTTRECIEQKVKTALKNKNNEVIECKLNNFKVVSKNNEFYFSNEFNNEITNGLAVMGGASNCTISDDDENVNIIPTEGSAKTMHDIEKNILCFDLSNAIEKKIKSSANDIIIVHCQDDCCSTYVSNFSKHSRYKNYKVTSSTFKDYFDEASTKQKKSGEKLVKKSWLEKFKNRVVNFFSKYNLLSMAGGMAVLGATYYCYQYFTKG